MSASARVATRAAQLRRTLHRGVAFDRWGVPDLASPGLRRILVQTARHNPPAVLGLAFILLITFSAIFAPLIVSHSPLAIDPANRLLWPSLDHPFGTDNLGRDVLSRVVYGARTSLYVGAMTVLAVVVLGTAIGLASGYFGGAVDLFVQRVTDAMQALPGLIFAMALVTILGPSINHVVLAIAFTAVPADARVIRSAVLRIKTQEFVHAARALGCGHLRVMARHVLPNVAAPLTIVASVTFGSAILAEAALSFLGLGTPPPNPSWGAMLSGSGRDFMEQVPTLALFPGLAIFFSVLSFNLLGDTLRDLLDPRVRRR